MTSFAYILGVLPLAMAKDAGAASRQALVTAVIVGMLASTLIAILFVPIYFVLMVRLNQWLAIKKNRNDEKATASRRNNREIGDILDLNRYRRFH